MDLNLKRFLAYYGKIILMPEILMGSNSCIEKSILQFDPLTSREKVSLLCISPIISYKNTVTLIIIINHWPLTILVSQLLSLQTLRYVVFCQIFHLLRV